MTRLYELRAVLAAAGVPAALFYQLLHLLKRMCVMHRFRAAEVRLSQLRAIVDRHFPAAAPAPPVLPADASSAPDAAAEYAQLHVDARHAFLDVLQRARAAKGDERGQVRPGAS